MDNNLKEQIFWKIQDIKNLATSTCQTDKKIVEKLIQKFSKKAKVVWAKSPSEAKTIIYNFGGTYTSGFQDSLLENLLKQLNKKIDCPTGYGVSQNALNKIEKKKEKVQNKISKLHCKVPKNETEKENREADLKQLDKQYIDLCMEEQSLEAPLSKLVDNNTFNEINDIISKSFNLKIDKFSNSIVQELKIPIYPLIDCGLKYLIKYIVYNDLFLKKSNKNLEFLKELTKQSRFIYVLGNNNWICVENPKSLKLLNLKENDYYPVGHDLFDSSNELGIEWNDGSGGNYWLGKVSFEIHNEGTVNGNVTGRDSYYVNLYKIANIKTSKVKESEYDALFKM